jgi:hypothetical protein
MRAKIAWPVGTLLTIVIVGCSAAPSAPASPTTPPPRTLTGVVTLVQNAREMVGGFFSNGTAPVFTLASIDDMSKDGAPCESAGGYSDLTAGRQVTIYGPKAEVLATVPLGAGTYHRIPQEPPSLSPGASLDVVAYAGVAAAKKNLMCTFAFEASGIAQGETLSVEIGTRGRLTYTNAQLEASGWHIELVLPNQ